MQWVPELSLIAGSIVVLAVSSVASLTASDATPDESPDRTLVYFGSYTGAKSKGIYVSKLDPATGELTPPELAAEASSPSFLAVRPDQRFLYAVNEGGSVKGKKGGGVSAFSINPSSGKLTLLNQQPAGGNGPCHLNVDHSGKYVLVANYGGGSCAVFPIESNGQIGDSTAFVQHQGSSVNKQRQAGPHAHGIYLDPQNRHVFVPDLGLDKVLIYMFDAARGSLTPSDPAFAAVAPGSGPRHFTFDPKGGHAYVINEMLCTVTLFKYDRNSGALEPGQTLSTLRPGESVLPAWSTAELEIHPTGKFLYGSNRGHDTIVVYSIDPQTGELTLVQHAATGKTPRGFGIDPSGRFLLAAAQDGDSVVSFQIDQQTGRLTPTGHSVSVGSPVCVKFVSVEN